MSFIIIVKSISKIDAVKSSSTNDQLFVNGKFMGSVQHGEDFTAYVSPMMTFAKDKFTKH